MSNSRQPDLNLTAVPLDGSESLFDGSSAISGVHLRWSFTPEIGFPRGGFELYRRRYHDAGEFGLQHGAWEKLDVDLGLPYFPVSSAHMTDYDRTKAINKVLARISSPFYNPRLSIYEQ